MPAQHAASIVQVAPPVRRAAARAPRPAPAGARAKPSGSARGFSAASCSKHRARVGLGEREPQLVPEPLAADARPGPAAAASAAVLRLDREAQPGGVARDAPDAGRIVDERALVQHAQDAVAQVVERAGPGAHLAVGEPHGDRVDGHVAPREVLVERRPGRRRAAPRAPA